jgi:hypothetical protein
MKNKIIFSISFFIISIYAKATNYYVNDASTVGDIYATAIGAAGNNGLTPGTPKVSIQAIIAGYVLAAGDQVFIDAGAYNQEVLISGKSGVSGSNIVFMGAGTAATIITGLTGGSNFTVQMLNSNYITWKNVKVVCAAGDWAFAIYMNSNFNLISNCETDADQYGVDIERNITGTAPTNNTVENCVIKSKYVGIRIKSENTEAGGWVGSATTGPLNNIVRDNIVTVANGATDVFSAMELQATRANTIYRNKFILNSNSTTGGTVFIGHSCTGIVFQNNYVINHKPYLNTTDPNPAIMFDDNSGASILHNSFYAESHCFYFYDGGASGSLTNVTMYNNILYSNLKNAVHFIPVGAVKFNFCDGNMYYAPSGNVAFANGANKTFAQWQTYDPDGANPGSEANGYNTNPNYVAPATDNLDLAAGSPAIDVVVVATAVVDDIYQTVRPKGAAKDIGAFEWYNILPVNLVFFAAECIGEGKELKWTTASEKNNSHFVIERSGDGITFTEIGSVEGTLNSTSLVNYTYSDNYNGKAYYRLRQVDSNGSYSYSNVAYAECGQADKSINVHLSNYNIIVDVVNDAPSCTITLYTLLGKQIHTEAHDLNKGLNTFIISYPAISTEAYIIQVISGKESVSKKLFLVDNR